MKKVLLTKGPFDERSFGKKVLLPQRSFGKGPLAQRSFWLKVLLYQRSFEKGPLAGMFKLQKIEIPSYFASFFLYIASFFRIFLKKKQLFLVCVFFLLPSISSFGSFFFVCPGYQSRYLSGLCIKLSLGCSLGYPIFSVWQPSFIKSFDGSLQIKFIQTFVNFVFVWYFWSFYFRNSEVSNCTFRV